jgi:glycosyltransferase involved in cell wall biosynthesis
VQHRCYRNSRAASALAAAVIAVHSELETWARFVDRFIVLTEFARDRLIRAGLPAGKLTLGTNFVGDPGPRESPPSRSRDVLFVGRISPEKGISVLIDAWRCAAPAGLRLVVIGDGPDRARLEGAALPHVEFVGRRSADEVMDAMMRARALVIPSVCYEMQPTTALEGMAAGLPLVVSKIGGLPELLEGRANGWTSPPNDAQALARTLAELAADSAVDERGAQARQRYLEAYEPSVAIPRLESVYSSVRCAVASARK